MVLRISDDMLFWDDFNVSHIEKHSVTIEEILLALKDSKIIYKPTRNKRFMALGRSGSRLLSLIINLQKDGKYYVVTARDMHKKERKIYRKENK